MESSQKQLEAKLNSFGQALHSLENALNQPYSEFLRDSVIQRFEYTWELTWKCCQALSRKAGQSADSPRAAIRFVYAQKLINVDEVDFWFEAIDMRNLAAHTYKESLAYS